MGCKYEGLFLGEECSVSRKKQLRQCERIGIQLMIHNTIKNIHFTILVILFLICILKHKLLTAMLDWSTFSLWWLSLDPSNQGLMDVFRR